MALADEAPKQKIETQTKKGRSAELIIRRNEKIADRFYFYSYVEKLNYEFTLEMLSKEFDIAAFTIAEIIIKQSEYLREIKTTKPTVKALKNKWPYLTWVYVKS